MLVIDIKEPVNIAGTWEELIAREMVALSVLGQLDVNTDQTSVTWAQSSPGSYVLSADGSNLAASGIEFTGGHVDGFHFLDRIQGTDAVVMRHFNRDVTVLQAKIDQSYQLFQDGASLPEAFAPLVGQLFRHRPLKVIGSDGDDIVEGGNKADILNGKAGNDVFHASRGNDTIHGGPGTDAVDYSGLGKLGGVNGGFDTEHISIGTFSQTISGIETATIGSAAAMGTT